MAVGTNHYGWVFLKTTFVSYDESNIPTVDEEGEIGVNKMHYTF
jgi:hypothetical protein